MLTFLAYFYPYSQQEEIDAGTNIDPTKRKKGYVEEKVDFYEEIILTDK